MAPRTAIDLQGEWEYAAPKSIGKIDADLKWEKLAVPGAAKGRGKDGYLMRRTLFMNVHADKRVLARFQGVNESFDLVVNGKTFAHPEPSYGFTVVFDVTDAIREGDNEFLFKCYNREFSKGEYLTRRDDKPGILGPIQLELVNPVYIKDVFVKPYVVDGKRVELEVEVGGNEELRIKNEELRIEASCENLKLEGKVENGKAVLKGDWPEAKLWTPDEPNLYTMRVVLRKKGFLSSETLDGVKQRFGMRELGFKGNRFLLNGHPFIARAGWPMTSSDHDEAMKLYAQTKARGCNAGRWFVGQGFCHDYIDYADEAGFMSMVGGCTENAGGSWKERVWKDGFNEKFWNNYDAFNLAFVREFRNNPSVVIWMTGCEFSAIFWGHPETEKTVQNLICASGEKMRAIDPTRSWVECGGNEVGSPAKGPGPAPTRSLHYPVGLNQDSCCFPDVGYWYPDGVVPWQQVGGFGKPVFITEDLFHGFQDSQHSICRAANDAAYTVPGYVEALRYGFSMFCEGYYYGGLAWWEPWMPFVSEKYNLLFDDYDEVTKTFSKPKWQFAPDFLVAMRPFSANVFAGEKDRRTLCVYNQTFKPADVKLVRTITLGGREIDRSEETFTLEQGGRRETEVVFDVPEVSRPSEYVVSYVLTAGDRQLTTREFRFTAFPKNTSIFNARGVALLRAADSPVKEFDKAFGAVAETLDALFEKRDLDSIVVAKPLVSDEGRKLNEFVMNGGKVLMLAVKEGDWSPVDIVYGKPVAFTFQRSAAMADFPDAALRCWRDDDRVTTSMFNKDGDEDTSVIRDCGLSDGLNYFVTGWLRRGKGRYLLSQLPLVEKWTREPAARPYFAALVAELVRVKAKPGRKFATWRCDSTNEYFTIDRNIHTKQPQAVAFRSVRTKGPSYNEIFRQSGILQGDFTNVLDEADVVFMDGSSGIDAEMRAAIDRVLERKGATVVVSELPDDLDTRTAFELGFTIQPSFVGRWRNDDGSLYRHSGHAFHVQGEYPKWIVPDPKSVLAGLTADDFAWFDVSEMWTWGRWNLTHTYYKNVKHDDSIMTAELAPLDQPKEVRPGSSPCAVLNLPYRNGRLVVSTLRFRRFFGQRERSIRFILRTLLDNLGCETSVAKKVYSEEPLDISASYNRTLWRNPEYRKADGSFEPEAWFGDDNDMRYFPVNLCGWSITANNLCPKEPFPAQPMILAGNRFLLKDPLVGDHRCITFLKGRETLTVKFAKPVKADQFRILGTCHCHQETESLDAEINGVKQSFFGGVHFSCRWWASQVPKGKVAWAGRSPKDPNAGIYSFVVPNPDPAKTVSEITFTNTSRGSGFAILAITAERE